MAAARQYPGDDALYLVAALSGLTDMDGVTLSTGRMVEQTSGGIEASIGWRLLVVAAISNLIFKSGIIAVVGGRKLFWRVLALFLLPIACGIALLIFWR